MKVKKFLEMFNDTYDYDVIISNLKKRYGWGLGVINLIDDFETNDEYFMSPVDDEDYTQQFNIFLTDHKIGKMRGKLNNTHSLRLGKWKLGYQVDYPTSFYNKLS